MQKDNNTTSLPEDFYRKPSAARIRIISMVAVAFILLTGFFLASNYYSTIRHAETLTLKRLQGIVNNLAIHINCSQHQAVSQRYAKKDEILSIGQDQDYDALHHVLAQAYKANSLNSPVYTFVKNKNSSNELKFIATSSDKPYFKHSYTSFPREIFTKLDQGGTMPLYEDEFGHWLSAFSPITNPAGQVVAYVQADEKFDAFMASVRRTFVRQSFVSLAGFIFIMFGLTHFLKMTLLQEEKLNKKLQLTYAETKRISAQLSKNEKQLREQAEKLKQSNQDLTDFAHIASHDLKAPIRNVHSFAQLIKRRNEGELDNATEEQLGFIIENTNRAQQLIAGLLSYSTADKDLGEPVIFPMHQAVEEAKKNLASIIQDSNAKLSYDKMPVVQSNPTLVSQVFQNLINNGIKYNQSGSPEITIGHGRRAADNVNYYFVRDNGIGIPEEFQKNIFKMFTRLHNRGEYEGSGIGLAFCHRVVTTYGGEMWLESIPNEGSTFYFTLPKATVVEEAVSTSAMTV